MILEYLREYRNYFHIGESYGVSESSAYKTVKWIEDTLIKHPLFALPGKRALLKSDIEYEVVLVDATETPVERPKKTKKLLLRKKKRHMLKTQVAVDQKTKKIIATAFSNGRRMISGYLRNQKHILTQQLTLLRIQNIKDCRSYMGTLECRKRSTRSSLYQKKIKSKTEHLRLSFSLVVGQRKTSSETKNMWKALKA